MISTKNTRWFVTPALIWIAFMLLVPSTLKSQQLVLTSFQYKSIYYEKSVRGLNQFLEQNSQDFDSETLAKLESIAAKIKKKRKKAIIWGIAGGAFLVVGPVLIGTANDIDMMGVYAIITSVGALGGLAGGLIVSPKDRDYYEFINTINSSSKNKVGFDKIE